MKTIPPLINNVGINSKAACLGAISTPLAMVSRGPQKAIFSASIKASTCLTFLSSVFIPTTFALANEANAPAVQSVTVEGKANSYDARRHDTASKLVVKRDELLKFGDSSLADAVKRLPGVTLGGGPNPALALRGMGNGYTQILLNGEKAPAGFSIDNLTPDMIERIEIVRAASADQSTEAIAGTINFVLRTVPKNNSSEAKIGVGSMRGKGQGNLNFTRSGKGDGWTYNLSGALSRRDSFVTENSFESGAQIDGDARRERRGVLEVEARNDVFSLAPSINFKLAGGDTLQLQTSYNGNRLRKDGRAASATLAGTPPLYASNTQLTTQDNDALRGDVAWLRNMGNSAKFTLRSVLDFHQRNGMFLQRGYRYDGVLNRDNSVASKIDTTNFSNSGKFSTPYREGHTITVGWEGNLNRRLEERNERDAALLGAPAKISDGDFDVRIHKLAVYAQDEWEITERFSLYLGLRLEQLDTHSKSTLDEGKGPQLSKVRSRSRVASPIVQALWKLPESEGDQLRLAVSRTYNPPALAKLIARPYTSTNNSPIEPDTQGNPNLRPELALGVDASFEHYWKGGSMFSIGGYYRQINDHMMDTMSLVNGRWVSSPNNVGRALSRGLEMDTKLVLQQFIKNAPAIELSFNLTRNWSNVEQVPGPNNRLKDQDRISSTLGVDYVLNPMWSLGGSYSYKTGDTVRISATETTRTAPRRDVDLYALWKIDDKTKLRLTAGNALRQDVITGDSYAAGSTQLDATTVRRGARTMKATLELKF